MYMYTYTSMYVYLSPRIHTKVFTVMNERTLFCSLVCSHIMSRIVAGTQLVSVNKKGKNEENPGTETRVPVVVLMAT